VAAGLTCLNTGPPHGLTQIKPARVSEP